MLCVSTVDSGCCVLQIFDIWKSDPLQIWHYDENLHLCTLRRCTTSFRIMCCVSFCGKCFAVRKEESFPNRAQVNLILDILSATFPLYPSLLSYLKCMLLLNFRKNLSTIVKYVLYYYSIFCEINEISDMSQNFFCSSR